MDWTIVGIIAGLMTSFSFIPQIINGFKTKSLEDLSYPMLVFLGSGLMLWLSYGLHLMNFAIILANTISVIFIITLIIMKFYFSKKTDRV